MEELVYKELALEFAIINISSISKREVEEETGVREEHENGKK
jgi:hypothetical protein